MVNELGRPDQEGKSRRPGGCASGDQSARAEIARLRATDDTAETEHDPPRQLNQGSLEMSTDPKVAYLAGVLDGFRLARAETQDEAEELIAEIAGERQRRRNRARN
jgi:hypothetical protein